MSISFKLKRVIQETFEGCAEETRGSESNKELLDIVNWAFLSFSSAKKELEKLENQRIGGTKSVQALD